MLWFYEQQQICEQKYREWEIGAFSCPSDTNSQFYLHALVNTFVYRCDEVVFENLLIVQRMKNLLEGSRLLDTDVKYKSKMQLPPAPVLVNLNGSSIISIFKWCHEEIPAFKSRASFIKMELPLKHRVGENEFSYLADTGKELIYLLTKRYMIIREIEVVSVKYYTTYIFV